MTTRGYQMTSLFPRDAFMENSAQAFFCLSLQGANPCTGPNPKKNRIKQKVNVWRVFKVRVNIGLNQEVNVFGGLNK